MGSHAGAFGVLMGALAAYVWTRDDSWRQLAPEAPLVMLVWPLAYLLGRPWNGPSRPEARSPARRHIACAALLLSVGTLTQSVLALALGWAALLGLGLGVLGVSPTHPRPSRLIALAAMGFPWLASDLSGLAWHLRTLAASVVAALMATAGAHATASGPVIQVGTLTVLVDESCSGMGALQVFLLLAATLLAAPDAADRSPVMVWAAAGAMALLANVLRVLGLAMLAYGWGADATRGLLHPVVGAAALVLPALLLARLAGRTRRGPCIAASS